MKRNFLLGGLFSALIAATITQTQGAPAAATSAPAAATTAPAAAPSRPAITGANGTAITPGVGQSANPGTTTAASSAATTSTAGNAGTVNSSFSGRNVNNGSVGQPSLGNNERRLNGPANTGPFSSNSGNNTSSPRSISGNPPTLTTPSPSTGATQ